MKACDLNSLCSCGMARPEYSRWVGLFAVVFLLGALVPSLLAQGGQTSGQSANTGQVAAQASNQRFEQLRQALVAGTVKPLVDDYHIGPQDLLDITVFEAPELNRTLRVSARGEISLPLLGAVKASGLTPQELETVLEELLRRTYMKDPHVGVFVRDMESHPVSVVGAVKKPGVFRISGAKTLLEMLSMSEGLADDAGGTVLVMRGAGLPPAPAPASSKPEASPQSSDGAPPSKDDSPSAGTRAAADSPGANSVEVNLKDLLTSDDPHSNVLVYPGDIVKVSRAGIVYVIGAVRKPGGFVLRNNENISALQALALAEGLTSTSAKSRARIIRTDPGTGQRTEISIDLGKIMASKAPDPLLEPKDIIFVPNSGAKTALYRGADAAVSLVSGVVIYGRY
jgi:polysaccharide export outer membrane protein